VVAAKYAHKLSSLNVLLEEDLKYLVENVAGFGIDYMIHLRAILNTERAISQGHQWYHCGYCSGDLAYSLGAEVKTCGSCTRRGLLRRIEFKTTNADGEYEAW
jgi:hypothetical protein